VSRHTYRMKRRQQREQIRHDKRVGAGGLVEVSWAGALMRVKPASAEVADQLEAIRKAAAVHGLEVVATVTQFKKTGALHLRFETATGWVILDWFPGTGTWVQPGGSKGTETSWRAVVQRAASVLAS
jgi:hypothetical protein